MATILRHIVDDIEKDLKQTFDNSVVRTSQVAYWAIMIGNRLKFQHIGKRDSGAFLSTFADIPVVKHTTNVNPNEIKDRKHIILPKSIYDYDQDRGISYISYYTEEEADNCPPPFTINTFTRTTTKMSQKLYFSRYEAPSPFNPYFYRIGDHLYFLGIEKVEVKKVEVGIYTTLDPITEIDLDAPFDFPEELIMVLKKQVLDLGRFSLLVPQERINDGTGDVAPADIPTQKLVSVNDEINQENQPIKR